MLGRDVRAVFGPEQVLEKNLEAVRQLFGVDLIQTEISVLLASHIEHVGSAEGIYFGQNGSF